VTQQNGPERVRAGAAKRRKEVECTVLYKHDACGVNHRGGILEMVSELRLAGP
jgi:hypothetical protein